MLQVEQVKSISRSIWWTDAGKVLLLLYSTRVLWQYYRGSPIP